VLRALERRLPARVDAVIATSIEVATRVGGTIIRPVWPEPRPDRSAAAVRESWSVPAAAPLVVAVGRLHRQKGFDTLVDAAALLRPQMVGGRVVIVGAGPAESSLRARIGGAGLDGVVTLVGPSHDAASALAAADVVAVPSIWESGPFVVPEAMALGRAVVATPVGFVPELVIDGSTGRTVPVGDAGALAGALLELLRDATERERLAAAARARVREWANRDKLIDDVVAVYRRVLVSR
jgi:glycosyltransferase involved in cell wall biosynthesis